MPKIPFDKIELLANDLSKKQIEAFEKNDFEQAHIYRQLYLGLLKGAGWTVEDYDAEMLKRISENWENKRNEITYN